MGYSIKEYRAKRTVVYDSLHSRVRLGVVGVGRQGRILGGNEHRIRVARSHVSSGNIRGIDPKSK